MKSMIIAIILTICLIIPFVIARPAGADIMPYFVISTSIENITGFAVGNNNLFARDETRKVEKQYLYDSTELTTYEYEGRINSYEDYLNNDYLFETQRWRGDQRFYAQFRLWQVDPINGKTVIVENDGAVNYTMMVDSRVYVTGSESGSMQKCYFKCFNLSPWDEIYSVDIREPGIIFIDGNNAYVQDNTAMREITFTEQGHKVPGGTWITPIHVFRKDSGTLITEFDVKDGVTEIFKYADHLVFAHDNVFDAGYSTITFVETISGEYNIDEELLYGPYGITHAIMAEGKIIGTLSETTGEGMNDFIYSTTIIVFDLPTRDAEFKNLSHIGLGIEYDVENEYVFIGVPESGDIYAYTLDAILNG